MHDIDSTARELVDELLDSEHEGLDPEAEMFGEVGADSETDLAAELLEVGDEAELDHFLGKLVKGAGRFLKSPAGKMLKTALKGVASKALPMAGSALGNMVLPGVGGAVGGQLATSLGPSLGLEAEAVSDEELQMEVAKRYVRAAKQSARQVAQDPRVTSSPRAVVRDAVSSAIGKNLPGLLKASPAGPVIVRGEGAASGRWVRRGNRIILFGV
jgi:hypothetical protein